MITIKATRLTADASRLEVHPAYTAFLLRKQNAIKIGRFKWLNRSQVRILFYQG